MTYQEQQEALFASIEARFHQGNAPSTIVDIQKDFSHDPQRGLTNIAFVPELMALTPVQELFEELRAHASTHYIYPPTNLHTTVQNVRVVHDPPRFAQEEIERIRPVLRAVAVRHAPIDVEWRGLLALPTSLAIKGFSSERFTQLVLDLHEVLIQAGVPDDKIYASMEIFASSITVCRYQHAVDERLRELIWRWRSVQFGSTRLERFSLVVCNSIAAQDATTIVETFPLGG